MTDETSVATNDESTAEVATTTDASPTSSTSSGSGSPSSFDTQLAAERVAERTVMRSIVRGVAISLPIGIAFFVGLIALAVGDDLEWYTIVGIGALLGLLAALLFGTLGGVVLAAGAFEEVDKGEAGHASLPSSG